MLISSNVVRIGGGCSHGEEVSSENFQTLWLKQILACRRKMVRKHSRMARGGHGLPKVSPGPAIPYPSMPYRFRAGPSAGRVACSYPFGHPTSYAYVIKIFTLGLNQINKIQILN
jgi:hypothetical protein